MIDFGQLLSQKISLIEDNWVNAVRHDQQIETTLELTYKAVLDSMPQVLKAMADVLSSGVPDSNVQSLVEASLEHGIVRAEQGFEPSEIAREYRLLRSVIFSSLEDDLLKGSPAEMLRAVRVIDTVIDEAIARCFNSYTEGRLRELEQLQSQLKLTNQELTRLVRASKTSLSELAHELKTPLTSIIGYSDTFLRQHRQKSNVRDSVPNLESIERVLEGGRQLLRLINDALEISRYESGQMKLQPTKINLPELIRGVVEMVKPQAASKELQIIVDDGQAPDSIVSDALRLQQIFTNLLSNAIRYSESGDIHLNCSTASDDTWTVIVIDRGIGIAPSDQQHIYNPYFRGKGTDSLQSADGLGLGLAIVARLVKLLQGSIELKSDIGVGSTFKVSFPLDITIHLSTDMVN